MDLLRIASRVASRRAAVPGGGGEPVDQGKFAEVGDWEFVEGEAKVTDNAITETVVGKTGDGRPFKGLITVYTEPNPADPSWRDATGWDYKALEGPEPEDAGVVQGILDAFDRHGL
jgi:hypothetical protein